MYSNETEKVIYDFFQIEINPLVSMVYTKVILAFQELSCFRLI